MENWYGVNISDSNLLKRIPPLLVVYCSYKCYLHSLHKPIFSMGIMFADFKPSLLVFCPVSVPHAFTWYILCLSAYHIVHTQHQKHSNPRHLKHQKEYDKANENIPTAYVCIKLSTSEKLT